MELQQQQFVFLAGFLELAFEILPLLSLCGKRVVKASLEGCELVKGSCHFVQCRGFLFAQARICVAQLAYLFLLCFVD
ncbi:MAG: hypothetical protein FD118_4116 [Rhodocyclaceae bacterium]|nr:MAG: hypothetical protein FD118_4116 [Rhodocyclaceae bacterium]